MTSENKECKMKRKTAERHLQKVKEAMQRVNQDDYFAMAVKRMVVFGSFVNDPDKDMISDLDIAVELCPKWPFKDVQMYAQMLQGLQCNRNYGELHMMGLASIEEAYRELRHGSGYVSIHNLKIDGEAVFSQEWMEVEVPPIKFIFPYEQLADSMMIRDLGKVVYDYDLEIDYMNKLDEDPEFSRAVKWLETNPDLLMAEKDFC